MLPIVWTWHQGDDGGGDWFGDCNTLLGLPLKSNMNCVLNNRTFIFSQFGEVLEKELNESISGEDSLPGFLALS